MSQNIIGQTTVGSTFSHYLGSGAMITLSNTIDYAATTLSQVTEQTTCFCCGKDLRGEKRVIHVEFDECTELIKCKECPKAQGMFCEFCVNEKNKMIEHIKNYHRSIELVDDHQEATA